MIGIGFSQTPYISTGANISLNNNSIPIPTDNTWCDETSEIADEPYGYPDHCWNHTNYDPTGAFFGTRDLPDTCFISDQDIYATKACHDSLFKYLPIATNFLQQTTIAQYCGRRGYHEYDPGEGFTPEQFANIRYSLEHDYTGCNIAGSFAFISGTIPILGNFRKWSVTTSGSRGGR